MVFAGHGDLVGVSLGESLMACFGVLRGDFESRAIRETPDASFAEGCWCPKEIFGLDSVIVSGTRRGFSLELYYPGRG
jgi:hypothetical protein